MDKSKAMKVMAESHRGTIKEKDERIQELEKQVNRYKARLETIANYINTENELDYLRLEGESDE